MIFIYLIGFVLCIVLLWHSLKRIKNSDEYKRTQAARKRDTDAKQIASNLVQSNISPDSLTSLKCIYVKGIDALFSNIPCQIDANKNDLIITTLDDDEQQFILDYSKILDFRLINNLQMEEDHILRMAGTAKQERLTINKYLGIRYKNKDSLKEILFLLDSIPEFEEYNATAQQDYDIFDYVKSRINPVDKTIKL